MLLYLLPRLMPKCQCAKCAFLTSCTGCILLQEHGKLDWQNLGGDDDDDDEDDEEWGDEDDEDGAKAEPLGSLAVRGSGLSSSQVGTTTEALNVCKRIHVMVAGCHAGLLCGTALFVYINNMPHA